MCVILFWQWIYLHVIICNCLPDLVTVSRNVSVSEYSDPSFKHSQEKEKGFGFDLERQGFELGWNDTTDNRDPAEHGRSEISDVVLILFNLLNLQFVVFAGMKI